MKRMGAVIFHPPSGSSDLEMMMASARLQAAMDLIEAVHPLVSSVIVVGDPSEFAPLNTRGMHVQSAAPAAPFHFGVTLQEIIRCHQLEAVLYFGSGSGALLEEGDLASLVAFAHQPDAAALFNNFYSCDFAAFSEAAFLIRQPLPENDNGLGFLLADAGVRCVGLPRSAKTQFDLDTPIDLLLLQASNRGGPRLRAFVETLTFDHPTFAGVIDVLSHREELVYLVGRVSPVTWQAFETQVACRTAGIVEGRGMKAYTRRPPSIVSKWFEKSGWGPWFTTLGTSAHAAIIDSRPLLAPDGVLPPATERFSSDFYQLSDLHDRRWSDFTREALDCPIPVLLGGHSLVSGGLYLLSEICWKGRNLPRRLHPDPYEGDGKTA